MFRILGKTNIDFMSRGKLFLSLSGVIILVCIGTLVFKGINRGIEFTGGTEMRVKFAETPDLQALRAAITDAGVQGTPVVTTIGERSLNEVTIRVAEQGGGEGGLDGTATRLVVQALRTPEDAAANAAGKLNLNELEEVRLKDRLISDGGVASEQAEAFAAEFAAMRRERAILSSFDDLAGLQNLTPEIGSYLEANGYFGSFVLRKDEYIGPAVGGELRNKALLAVGVSLAGILAYIGFRFEFRWGVAAIVALFHDTIVTLGLFSMFDQEMSLPVVAAFLTLVGYSVNDTVVVFDRIRENVRIRGGQKLEDVVNRSINQTLSRTVITSGLTWIVVLGLYLFGGQALKAFSFVLTVGVIVGTYSSICIASPVVVLWREAALRRKGIGAPTPSSKNGKTARKVRASSAS